MAICFSQHPLKKKTDLNYYWATVTQQSTCNVFSITALKLSKEMYGTFKRKYFTYEFHNGSTT